MSETDITLFFSWPQGTVFTLQHLTITTDGVSTLILHFDKSVVQNPNVEKLYWINFLM